MDKKKQRIIKKVNAFSFARCSDIAKLYIILMDVKEGINSVYSLKKHIKNKYGLSPSTTVKYLRILENAKVLAATENVNNHNKREFTLSDGLFFDCLKNVSIKIFGHSSTLTSKDDV